jgi:hypothetical protein
MTTQHSSTSGDPSAEPFQKDRSKSVSCAQVMNRTSLAL